MDKIFTEKLRQYLEKPESERNIEEGATMLLQLERNQSRYKSIILHARMPIYREMLFKRLKMHLQRRIDGYTLEEVQRMEPVADQVDATVKEVAVVDESDTVVGHIGKRADHDQLPEEARLKYQENLAIMTKMRRLHAQISLMREQSAAPCDLYEYLKQLLDLDEQRLQNWADYDAAKVVTTAETPVDNSTENETDAEKPAAATPAAEEEAPSDSEKPAEDPSAVIKEMQSARSYISRNLAALEELSMDETKLVEYTAKKKTMQERYARLVELGSSVKEETVARLAKLGITA